MNPPVLPAMDEEDVEALQSRQETEDDVIDDLPAFPREKTLSELSGMGLQSVRNRQKMISDVTGMKLDTVRQLMNRGDRRTLSDLVAMMNLPEEVARQRTRQPSSTDIVRRMGDTAGTADLRMAEQIQATGTYQERLAQGITKEEYEEKINEKPGVVPDGFVFSKDGLTSEEAAERLARYGRNELPEHVEPKWLIFLKQFWAYVFARSCGVISLSCMRSLVLMIVVLCSFPITVQCQS